MEKDLNRLSEYPKFDELQKNLKKFPQTISINHLKAILRDTSLYFEDSFETLSELNDENQVCVLQAISRSDNKRRALKIQIFPVGNPIKFYNFEKELELNRKVQKLASYMAIGVFKGYYITLIDQRKIGVIEMERACKTLNDIMKEKRNNKMEFSEQEKNKIYMDLLEYLIMLHSENIAHCDIKPSNIFYIGSDNKYVLGDFGISRQFSAEELDKYFNNSSRCFKMYKDVILGFTKQYISPEMRKIINKEKNSNYIDLFLNDVYSLGLVFLYVSAFNGNESILGKTKNKMEMAEKYPIYLKTDYFHEFKVREDKELKLKSANINYQSFDPRINKRIELFYKSIPLTKVLKKLEFELENDSIDHNALLNLTIEEKIIDEIYIQEKFYFKNLEKSEDKIIGVRKTPRISTNGNCFKYKYKEFNLLSLMLEEDPEKRLNIFEIFLLIEGKNRSLYKCNPEKFMEIIRYGIGGDFFLFFEGYSLENGDLTVYPYSLNPNENGSYKFSISYKNLSDEIRDKPFMKKKYYWMNTSQNFCQEKGIFHVNLISATHFELIKSKTINKNKQIIIIKFPNNFQSAENFKIFYSLLIRLLKKKLLYVKKINFNLEYNNFTLEKVLKATISLFDFRKTSILGNHQKIKIIIIRNELISKVLFLNQLVKFLKKLITKSPFLMEFNNKALFDEINPNTFFNFLILNYLHFSKIPHHLFDRYCAKDIGTNKPFQNYSFKGMHHLQFYSNAGELFLGKKKIEDSDLSLQLTCEDDIKDPFEDYGDENITILDEISLVLSKIKSQDFYSKIKSLEIVGNSDVCSKKLPFFIKKCENLLKFACDSWITEAMTDKLAIEILNCSKLRIINFTAAPITDKLLNFMSCNQNLLQNLESLTLSECNGIEHEATLINFISENGLKLKKLDISSIPCVNAGVLQAFHNSDLKFHMKELKLADFNIKLEFILLFIKKILEEENIVLESLIFKNMMGISPFKSQEIKEIKDLLEKYPKWLSLDICDELEYQTNIQKTLFLQESKEIWGQEKLTDMIFKIKKNYDLFHKSLENVLLSLTDLCFDNINFLNISDFNFFYEKKISLFKKIKVLEFRKCEIPKSILEDVITREYLYKTLKISLDDIHASDKKTKTNFLFNSLEIYINSRRKFWETLILEFGKEILTIEICLESLIVSHFSFEEFCEIIINDSISQNFIREVHCFNRLIVNFSENGYNKNSNSGEIFLKKIVFENKTCKKLELISTFSFLNSAFDFLEEGKDRESDISNVTLKNIDLKIIALPENFEGISRLFEKIRKIFEGLKGFYILLDFVVDSENFLRIQSEIHIMVHLIESSKTFKKFVLGIKLNSIIDKFLNTEENFGLSKEWMVKIEFSIYNTYLLWVFKKIK